MAKKPSISLRHRAEEALKLTAQQVRQMPKGVLHEVLCELQLHQIELEMQNEDLRQTKFLLESSRQRFAELYDFSPVGYLTLDAASYIVEANQSAAQLLAHPSSALLGCRLEQFIAPADQPALRSHIQKAQQSDQKETIELALHRPHGPSCVVSLITQMRGDPPGTTQMLYLALSEVTKRKQLEETVRQHNATLRTLVKKRTQKIRQLLQQRLQGQKLTALGQLAAGVAHEINNPLAALMNAFALVKTAVPSTHPKAHFLSKMDKEFERLVTIIRHMYQLYGSQPLSDSQGKAAELMQDAVRLVQRKLDEHVVTVQCTPIDPAWLIPAPTGPLVQVLANVLSNAIEVSPKGSVVRVEMEQGHDDWLIHVSDRGPGIARKDLPRVFEPFYSTKTLSSQPGMGLGLSISRSLAIQMGGDLSVVSQPGVGSTFTVKVPRRELKKEPDDALTIPNRKRKNPAVSRVLLVDDEPTFLEATQILLCEAGYACETAQTIEEALGKLASPIDLLISDVGLPGNTELWFFRAVYHRWPKLPVLLLSGALQEIERVKVVVPELIIERVFLKPLNMEQLYAVMEEVLSMQETKGT